MEKIKSNCIIPSSAFSVPKSQIKHYDALLKKCPEVGDLVFGEVSDLGHHLLIENRSGRLHTINIGTRSVFVFGNRYAPDQFEGLVPSALKDYIDLLSRGGVVGKVKLQNQLIGVATKVRILGYVCNTEGKVINTKDHVLLHSKNTSREKRGAKVILCIGTSMNSGKTHAAAACCYAISSMGRNVRAAKLTGTASLKDILLMNDCGAEYIADFTYFGYPSTYLLESDKLLEMFHSFDMKYGNNPKNYLVIELADGIFQRETAMLLKMPEVQARIHKLIFCAPDSTAVFGGIKVLKEQFNLTPDAISGLCSSSPLAVREIQSFSDLPILQSIEKDYRKIFDIIG
ncbi:MAG: hypothetical protein GDA44_00085 [Prochloron sp. SP5CPC1]|nr:hypothetical protein [Candidatus Paraprochloron terpiosi SP5CPC1]